MAINSGINYRLDDRTRALFTLLDQTRDAFIYALELELKQYKINFPTARILYMLTRDREKVAINDIAKWILRRLNTVSTLVIKMEKKGLVRRIKNKGDSRIYVIITKKGIDLWEQLTEQSVMLTFAVLSEDEKEQLESCLNKLRTELRSLLALDYKPPFMH